MSFLPCIGHGFFFSLRHFIGIGGRVRFQIVKKPRLTVDGDAPLAPASEHLALEPGYLCRHLLQFRCKFRYPVSLHSQLTTLFLVGLRQRGDCLQKYLFGRHGQLVSLLQRYEKSMTYATYAASFFMNARDFLIHGMWCVRHAACAVSRPDPRLCPPPS